MIRSFGGNEPRESHRTDAVTGAQVQKSKVKDGVVRCESVAARKTAQRAQCNIQRRRIAHHGFVDAVDRRGERRDWPRRPHERGPVPHDMVDVDFYTSDFEHAIARGGEPCRFDIDYRKTFVHSRIIRARYANGVAR